MKKLIPVGFFRELTNDPEEQLASPSITETLSELPQENEENIARYLRHGICLSARGCIESDYFDPSSKVPLFAHTYTDGVYLWRLDLAHYVEKYHVRLPTEFIRHMASLNWNPPANEDIDIGALEV